MRKFEVAKGWEDKDINLPQQGTKGSAGYDFEAAEDTTIPSMHNFFIKSVKDGKWELSQRGLRPTLVPTGVKAYMQEDEFLALYNRSSMPLKQQLMLANNTAVIDSTYYNNASNDGHIMFQFINFGENDVVLKKGTRIGQGIFHKYLLADDGNSEEERIGGFGSTGE